MADLVITIDGPAASGKSTVARRLAEVLSVSFLDTGAMYRAFTLAAMRAGISMSDERQLVNTLGKYKFRFEAREGEMGVYINGIDMTDQIRKQEVTDNVRYIASSAKMREKLVQMQKQFAVRQRKLVTEGRDQGTVAFPNADFKFYLTAAPAERAKRRAKEQGLTSPAQIEQIQKDIEARDASDSGRAVGPLKPADDAVAVDTTDLAVEEVVEKLIDLMEKNG